MSDTTPRPDQGSCETRSCVRPYGHKGGHLLRTCFHEDCQNRSRNSEEPYCTVHEPRSTYERYVNPDGSLR